MDLVQTSFIIPVCVCLQGSGRYKERVSLSAEGGFWRVRAGRGKEERDKKTHKGDGEGVSKTETETERDRRSPAF